MGAGLAIECERAHLWVSLELDGELSQVEESLLRAHVGRCAACARFAGDVGSLTQEIRAAPYERPDAGWLGRGLPERRRSAGTRLLRLGAAAAAVAIAAGLGSLAGSLSSSAPTRTRTIAGPRISLLPATRSQA